MSYYSKLFEGKIGRKDFLIGFVVYFVASYLADIFLLPRVLEHIDSYLTYNLSTVFLVKLILFAPVLIYLLSITVRRLNDIGRSRWLSLIYLVTYLKIYHPQSAPRTMLFYVSPLVIEVFFTLYLISKPSQD